MKTWLFTVFVLSSPLLFSQNTVTGTIPGWDNGPAEIVSGISAPMVIGAVEEGGAFSMQLEDDFKTKYLADVEKHNAGGADWKMEINSIEEAFTCTGNSIEISNGDQPLIFLSNFGSFAVVDMEEQKSYGTFMITSSEAFARGMMAAGQYKNEPGYYIDYLYLEKPSTVKGECTLTSYMLNQEDTYDQTTVYDMDLQAGWNIVKYEVEEVEKDTEGNSYISRFSYTNLDEVPGEVQYLFMPR